MAALGLVVLTALGTARSAPAPVERSGLDQVPASAPIVVHVRGVQGVRDRLVAMMENALPQVLKKFQPQMDEFLKNGAAGRKLRGLAKDGPLFVVFTELPKPGEEPKVAVIVAVTNYKEFRDNLLTDEERKDIKTNGNIEKVSIDNKPAYFVDRKTYAILSPNEDVATELAKKQAGLDGKLSKELAGKLMAADLSVYISMDTLNRQYAEQMKQARQGLEQLIDLGAAQAGKSEKGVIELAKNAIGPIFQTVEDSQGLLVTIEFRPGGLAFHAQSELRADTPTARTLQEAKPTAFAELARMPDGRTYYTGIKASSALYKSLGALMYGIIQDKDSKDAREVTAAIEALVKAGPGVQLDATSLPPAGLRVSRFEEPAKAVAAQLKLIEAMSAGGTIQSGTLKEKPAIKKAAEKYGDFELHSVELVWDLDKMADAASAGQGEEAKKKIAEGMKKLMGEKMHFWFGTDGKVVVQVSAADWATARKILDQYFKSSGTVGDVPAFREVRKEMPAEATVLGVIDAVQYMGSVAELLKPTFGALIPPNWPNLPGKGAPTFVGVSVTLRPQRGSFDTFISAAAAQEFYKAFLKPILGE
jgi:hypothetical protein